MNCLECFRQKSNRSNSFSRREKSLPVNEISSLEKQAHFTEIMKDNTTIPKNQMLQSNLPASPSPPFQVSRCIPRDSSTASRNYYTKHTIHKLHSTSSKRLLRKLARNMQLGDTIYTHMILARCQRWPRILC